MPQKTVNHKEIMNFGFKESTASGIIRQAKALAILEFNEAHASENQDNMVKLLRKSPFDNKRLDLAPTKIVEGLLGFKLFTQEKEKNS